MFSELFLITRRHMAQHGLSRSALLLTLSVGLLGGCAQSSLEPVVAESAGAAADAVADTVMAETSAKALQAALDAQSDEHKARYDARHPGETLSFFGIKPGMTVAEALPGGGWYTKVIAAYLGGEGTVYGVNYQESVWTSFGWSAERVAQRVAATAKFPSQVDEWAGNGIAAQGFTFASVPSEAAGTADAVLFVRALHNLSRFNDTGVLDEAIAAAHTLLKPGGIVGVVQHRAPENAPDEWATGRAGYLKPSAVIAMFTKAGFTLDGSSEINANAKDQPTTKDVVWRLPPSYALGADSRDAMDAIGESDRMTLRFRKS